MIDFNIAYYPPWDKPYTISMGATDVAIGNAICYIWDLYDPDDEEHLDTGTKRGKPLDTSIYLWYVANGCAFGTNTCVSFAVGNNLNMEVKTDDNPGNTPLALAAWNYGFDGQYMSIDRGLRSDPCIRLAYDETFCYTDVMYGGWAASALLYNINPLDWCIYPQMAVYRYDTHVMGSLHDLNDIVTYMNADTTRRVVNIRSTIYRGPAGARITSKSGWHPYSSLIDSIPVVGLLKDRPICDNLRNTLGAYIQLTHDDYIWDRVYNPFNQINSTWHCTGRYDTDSAYNRQLDIGFAIQTKANSLVSGRNAVPDSHGRCSSFFAHYSPKQQDFDDVTYHWRTCLYDESIDRELPEGYNLAGIANHDLRVMAVLEIDDWKGAASYGEAVKRAILHEVAFMGFWIVDNPDKAINDPLGLRTSGVGVYLPEKINGVTTGRYFTGEEIQTVPYAGATDVSPFEHTPDPSETDIFHIPTEVTAIPRFGATYLCDLENISNVMYNLKTMDWSQENLEELFFGQNPYDFIISASAYPFVDYPLSSAAILSDIELGKVNLNELPDKVGDCQGYRIMGGIVQLPNPFGSIRVDPYYSLPKYELDFLDYEPYTQIFLYIPYCGMVSIPPNVFMGQTIYIDMSWDTLSGDITAYIKLNDRIEYLTATGNVLTEIPVSGRAYADYYKLQTDLSTKSAQTLLNTVGSVSGHIAGASVSESFGNQEGQTAQSVMAATSGLSGALQFMHTIHTIRKSAPAPVQVSNGSASIGTGNDQDAHLIIVRPKLPDDFDIESFKRVNGRATAYCGKLSTSSGFTQMINPILDGINCTAEEKMLIIKALADGVIL